MSYFSNKVIVITGASSGIGRALAIQLADKDVNLILTARNFDNLQLLKEACEKKEATCTILCMDMASSESIAQFVAEVSKRYSKVDVLINCAGLSQRSHAEETSIEVIRKIMEVNFFAQVNLTKSLWSLLLQSPHANIVLISSVVGTFGFPQRSGYSASKHALEGFFESWMLENQRKNIFFTTISPGRIHTNISYSALKADGSLHQQLDEGQAKGIKPEVCAHKIIRGIIQNKRKVYVAQGEMLLIFLRKCFPFFYFKLVKKLKLK